MLVGDVVTSFHELIPIHAPVEQGLGDDFIEILLNQRLEIQYRAHAGLAGRLVPFQKAASVRGRTLPFSNSSSRFRASTKASSGVAVPGTLRSNSAANLRRERWGRFRARVLISEIADTLSYRTSQAFRKVGFFRVGRTVLCAVPEHGLFKATAITR
jgi:hypothetical protein